MSEKEKFIEKMKLRTKQFALRIIKLYQSLPTKGVYKVIGYQLLKAGTSVGANYRAVCRARSKADFFSKISIVIEEADESAFWLEVLIESGLIKEDKLKDLLDEAIEITKILSTARKNI